MCKVLFVDDEPRVLEGLRRALYGLETDWQAEFATSARSALEMLEQGGFDVVVTDMRMPDMSGAELLWKVAECWPHVVRVVLSGQADEEVVLQTVTSSHLFLQKPCAPEDLDRAVRSAISARMLLQQSEVAALVARVGVLPSPPTVYLRLLDELRHEEPSLRRVAEIVESDPGVAAKVLQLVNSAYFGMFGKVSDLQRAVSLLGFDTLKALVVSLKAFSITDSAELSWFDSRALFEHSLQVARKAHFLASRMQVADMPPKTAFTAGLLHDIGKLVLAKGMPEQYRALISSPVCSTVADCESQAFGATHAEVGAYLMALWGLPDEVAVAIADHHAPERFSGKLGAQLLYAADRLVHKPEVPTEELATPLDEPLVSALEALRKSDSEAAA